MARIPFITHAAGVVCMAFAIAASAQTAGASAPAASSESVGQHVDDTAITTKVKTELLGAKNVKSAHIHVKTQNGVVWLTGTVPSTADREHAKEVVEGVSGVTSVKNNLKVVAE